VQTLADFLVTGDGDLLSLGSSGASYVPGTCLAPSFLAASFLALQASAGSSSDRPSLGAPPVGRRRAYTGHGGTTFSAMLIVLRL